MGLLDYFRPKPVQQPRYALPMDMIGRFLANGQVQWMQYDAQGLIDNAYLGNHIIFAIQDWKSSKVASAPPLLYEVKEEKSYRKYRMYLKDATYDSFRRSQDIKTKALVEVEGHDLQKVLDRPNPNMTRYEFEYGMQTYIDIVGAGYQMAVRDGMDGQSGKIKELYLPPAHQMVAVTGDIYNPVKEWFLNSAPDKKIAAANVCQIRNFSPRYESGMQWIYGLSRLHAAKGLIQKHKDAQETEVSVFQKRGIRDIIFPKGSTDPSEISLEDMNRARDNMNQKIGESGTAGIITNNIEIGSIRIGFSPTELGILETIKDAKVDLCSLYHVPADLFGWGEHSTYNNMTEKIKIGLRDAILPELEKRKDAYNSWLVPSYGDKNLVMDYDYDYFHELQPDKKELAEWMDKVPLTPNERRAPFGYEALPDENMNKAMIGGNYKLVEDMGIESFAGSGNFGKEDGLV